MRILINGKYPKEVYEQYRYIALGNGVRKELFAYRLYTGWSLERACTQPVKLRLSKAYIKRAKENYISRKTYYARLTLGWDKERACTQPVRDNHSLRRFLTDEQKALRPQLSQARRVLKDELQKGILKKDDEYAWKTEFNPDVDWYDPWRELLFTAVNQKGNVLAEGTVEDIAYDVGNRQYAGDPRDVIMAICEKRTYKGCELFPVEEDDAFL